MEQLSTSEIDEDEHASSNEEHEFNDCLPLFKDSSLTVPEFNAVLLAIKQTHNFSNQALDSILKMVEMCLPEGNKLPYSSSYLFERKIERELMYSLKKYFTCAICQTLLTNEQLCENNTCVNYQNSGKGDLSSVFYTIDILPELKRLIAGKMSSFLVFLVKTCTRGKVLKCRRKLAAVQLGSIERSVYLRYCTNLQCINVIPGEA